MQKYRETRHETAQDAWLSGFLAAAYLFTGRYERYDREVADYQVTKRKKPPAGPLRRSASEARARGGGG